MVSNMKTTIEISETLLDAARALAARNGTTLRALVEAGLRRTLAEHEEQASFRLPDKSADGNGLQADYRGADWDDIRRAAYGDGG